MARGGLGKGLNTDAFEGSGLKALLGEEIDEERNAVRTVPLSRVEPRPGQPRHIFDVDTLDELSQSIREHGILQPITVRELSNGYYQIIAGERRWRAARLADLREVPVLVIEADDRKAEELALVENLQREDLNPVEEAKGYKTLIENYSLTQEQAAQRVGKSRPVVTNALRLLNLPEDVLSLLEVKAITLSHARALLELDDPAEQSRLAALACDRQLSVKELTARIKRAKAAPGKKPAAHPLGADGVDYYAEAEKALGAILGRKVHIGAGTKKGKIEIEYYGNEDFEAIYRALLSLKKEGKPHA